MKNQLRVFLIFGIFYIFQGCDYFDTVDLTNSIKFKNGSYQYEDVLIPKEKTQEYNFQILFNGDYETVPKHIRGCVCHLKTCIRFCCNAKQLLLNGRRTCEDIDKNIHYNMLLNITYNETLTKNISDLEFMVQQHLPVPCHDHNYLEPDNPDHTWTLYENGTLLRHFDSALLPKQDYCLQPRKFQDLYKLVPHHCLKPPDHTNAYMQSVSIFFLLMVIIVYLILPNFKGDYFKCSICYFSCLTLSFILIVIVRFQWIEPHQKVLCQLTGYIGYYFTISTFLWLLIINYDLWKAFNTIVITRRTRYLNYHIFVWGLAALQLLVTYIVALVVNIDSKWAPNIGTYACWIDTTAWSARIYYYGPIGIYLTLSTTLFIKTASEIFVQNRKNRLQLINSESQRSLRSLTNFAMFLRLFIIMGVLWILEVISYFGEFNHIGTTILDIFNCNQGIILFVATILKKDVLKSLANRVGIGEQISQSGPSTTSP